MSKALLIATLIAVGLAVGGALAQQPADTSAGQPADSPAGQPADTLDLGRIIYDIQQLPTINSLDLTREQIDRLLPVLEAAAAERERMAEQPSERRSALEGLREALLRGELPEEEVIGAVRKHAGPVAAKGRASPELARLANEVAEILTEDQLAVLTTPRGRPVSPEKARIAAAQALDLLRRLPQAAYVARREKLADAIAARTQEPGTFQFEQARTAVVNDLDRVRALSDEEFDQQRAQSAADLTERWGGLASRPDLKDAVRGGAGKAREDRGVANVEKLYSYDDQQYPRRRQQVVEAAVEHRLALDPAADPEQVRAEVIEQLDAMRALPPWEFEGKKAEIAESLLGASASVDPRALTALQRLADPRMIRLLRAKAEYL